MGLGHPIPPVNKYISRTPLPGKSILIHTRFVLQWVAFTLLMQFLFLSKRIPEQLKDLGLEQQINCSSYQHAAKQNNTAIALTSFIYKQFQTVI